MQEAQDKQRYEHALRLHATGQLDAAADALQSLLLSPNIAQAKVKNSPSLVLKYLLYKNLANIYQQLGKLQEAHSCFAHVC